MERFEPEDAGVLRYYGIYASGLLWRILDVIAGVFFCTMAIVFSERMIFLYGFAALGAFWLLRGLSGLLSMRGVTLDRARGRFRVWRGWLVPLWFTTGKLERYRGVQISKKQVRERRRFVQTFALHLVGPGGLADELTAKRDYLSARRMAEEIALYLGFDLLDATVFGQPVKIEAANVGKSLREQTVAKAAAAGIAATDEIALPPPPPNARAICTLDGSLLFIAIQRPRFLRLLRFPIFLTFALGGVGAAIGFGLGALVVKQPWTWDGHIFAAICITLSFAALGILYGTFFVVLPQAFVRYNIEAHPGGLTVRRRGLIFRRTREMPSNELRELRAHSWGLEAIGTKQLVRFADNKVSGAELVWLRDAIEKAVTG